MITKALQTKRALWFSSTATALLLLTGIPAAADADKDSAALQDCALKIDAATKPSDETTISTEIAGRFTTFAGSETNASALVSGLHTGSSTTLISVVNGKTTSTAFIPATGRQGFGNVCITLALAREGLAKLGISHPTPVQLETVLNGGTLTTTIGTVTLSGILSLRASGQGWDQIARAFDITLGRVLHDTRDTCERIEWYDRRETTNRNRSTRVDREVD